MIVSSSLGRVTRFVLVHGESTEYIGTALPGQTWTLSATIAGIGTKTEY
jgi:hypothetical protein